MLLGKIRGIFEYKIEDAICKKNYEIHIKINVYHIFIVDKHILKWYFFS